MRILPAVLLLSLAACASDDPASPDHSMPMPPNNGLRPIHSVPGGSGAADLLFGPGSSFLVTGPTAPGNATFTAAPYSEDDFTNAGTGGFDITVDGTQYASTVAESFALGMPDENGDRYLALVAYHEYTVGTANLVDEVVVIVPSADFAPGATVALDGDDRIAFFMSGDPETDEPTVFAAATTGSVTFGAGSLTVGGNVSASVQGDFGSIEWIPDTRGGNPGTITDGTYTVTLGTAEVYCDGSLAGQEAAFASIAAADLGFSNGSVTLANAGAAVTASGAPIASGFGTASLSLDYYEDGVFAGFIDEDVPGPANTTRVGKYFVVDSATATSTFVNGAFGAGYVVDDGGCSVAFGASLTIP